MTPERAAALVGRWVRFYTRDLPTPIAERRIAELDADLHDHLAHERATGTGDSRIALGVLSRMLRGLPADYSWRSHLFQIHLPENVMKKQKTAYRSAVVVALFAALTLLWGLGAVGLIGVEGDRADLMYLGVLAVGVVGTLAARFRPAGMSRALLATAAATAVVAVIAFALGKHHSPATSVLELLGLNAFFTTLFAASAYLFHQATPHPTHP
ncbi:hypothetical protein [Amycolatopsis magusensis]|uniref:Uncharacterized protein n=1 Tax=Amycolatopsis magusensis TaxID=882444 RepID=A0ABS4PRY3_9PSEU|nr:hypothetical protein [Amycolatopsis magusensis]MBP2181629.1 hypothetical protein [Amycolatopsis magusensis]